MHKDHANLPYDWCAITALGSFDCTKGGHLIFWELGLVIQFPPGSTIFIPSASVTHSNTPIASGEKHFSMTQYTAGSIFRWVDHGFKSDKDYYASLTKEGQKKVGNVTGYPGVFQGNPHPYPSKPAPASTGAGFHRYG